MDNFSHNLLSSTFTVSGFAQALKLCWLAMTIRYNVYRIPTVTNVFVVSRAKLNGRYFLSHGRLKTTTSPFSLLLRTKLQLYGFSMRRYWVYFSFSCSSLIFCMDFGFNYLCLRSNLKFQFAFSTQHLFDYSLGKPLSENFYSLCTSHSWYCRKTCGLKMCALVKLVETHWAFSVPVSAQAATTFLLTAFMVLCISGHDVNLEYGNHKLSWVVITKWVSAIAWCSEFSW